MPLSIESPVTRLSTAFRPARSFNSSQISWSAPLIDRDVARAIARQSGCRCIERMVAKRETSFVVGKINSWRPAASPTEARAAEG